MGKTLHGLRPNEEEIEASAIESGPSDKEVQMPVSPFMATGMHNAACPAP